MHMQILSSKPASVILSQRKYCEKSESDDPKVPKQAEAKEDGVINPHIIISLNANTENVDALKRYE